MPLGSEGGPLGSGRNHHGTAPRDATGLASSAAIVARTGGGRRATLGGGGAEPIICLASSTCAVRSARAGEAWSMSTPARGSHTLTRVDEAGTVPARFPAASRGFDAPTRRAAPERLTSRDSARPRQEASLSGYAREDAGCADPRAWPGACTPPRHGRRWPPTGGHVRTLQRLQFLALVALAVTACSSSYLPESVLPGRGEQRRCCACTRVCRARASGDDTGKRPVARGASARFLPLIAPCASSRPR
jgi:hypothetical protein